MSHESTALNETHKYNFYISKVQSMHVMQISGLVSTILHILEGIKSFADLIVQNDSDQLLEHL